MDGAAVAPLVEVVLIFLTCSLTLDLASTIEVLGPDVVERKRTRGFVVEDTETRILVVACKDICSSTRRVLGQWRKDK